MFDKILVLRDGSESGETALQYVKGLTEKLKSKVTLLQVLAPGLYVQTIGWIGLCSFS
jgi:nucleotide-binding universal stress UspA family protein